jgi:prepilin-type N-terminal cleavage/methylation domain-containing protein
MATSCFLLGVRRRVHRDQGGFTLVEMMVALVILFIVMTSVAFTATMGLKYAAVARQRETAGGFAMKHYQEALALPFNAIKQGLNPTLDTTYPTDTNIVTNSSICKTTLANAPCVKVPGVASCGASTCYESVAVTPDAAGNACPPSPQATPPLCQHQVSESAASGSSGVSTSYSTVVYVTTPPTSICNSCYRVVVTTSWVAAGATKSITYQSLMTNTSGGCLATSSHPFSGPCGSYLNGSAIIPQGSITITPNTSGGTSIQNVNLGRAAVSVPQDSASSQSSQVSVVQGVATTSSISLGLGTSDPTVVGAKYLPAQGDSDPTLPSGSSQQTNLSGTPDASGSASAQAGSSSVGNTTAGNCGSTSVNAVCLTKANTDLTGSATATASASASPSCNGVLNSMPCGYSVSQTRSASGCTGTMSACVVVHLFNGGTDLGTCTLVSVGAPSSASSAQVSQNTTSVPQPQTAKVSRTLGQVTFGCIPSAVATPPTSWNKLPAGFTSVGTTNTGFLVAVQNGYTQTLQAQAGITSPATSATVSGTEWYYQPGTTSQAGGTLVASVPDAATSYSAGGTLSAAVAPTSNPTGGTLNANIRDAVATWSAGATLNAALSTTTATFSAGATLNAALANTSDTLSTIGTLTNAITSSQTTFNVTQSSSPATPFTIKIGSEKMLVTGRTTWASGNHSPCSNNVPCYTVTRAQNGTTAAAASAGATVSQVVTPGCPSPCTFNVTETSAPPTGTPFTIQVDSEQMSVTSRTLVSGSTYTYVATRATNSTTAAAHSSGAIVNYNVPGCPSPCSFNVTETSAPPTGTPFTIKVDSEQMSVTSRTLVSGSTYTYTATRATNSTTAAAHSSGAIVNYNVPGCPSPCTFNVTETSAPPTSVPFTIQVDSEQMSVTSRTLVSGSTYTYTATRATNSTTAAAHTSGATFSYVVSWCTSPCSFDVNETSSPPSGTPFSIKVDNEEMLVTTRVKYPNGSPPSGCVVDSQKYCYTVTRAQNGTTAAAHSSGATFSYITGGCPTPCSFNVTETSSPPSSAPFTIQIDSEQMQVTSRTLVSGSTYTYTATRAYNSTSTSSHASGATVTYLSVPFGYMALADSSPSGTALSPLSVNYTTGGCTYRESVNGALTSPSGSVANTTTGGIVSNSAGSMTAPLTGDFKFNVTCGSTVVADLDIAVDLGAIKTTATYSPPAS